MVKAARAVALKAETRAGGTARASKMAFNSVNADSIEALRLQRLRLLGVIGARADLIANLAWGEAA